MRQLVWHVKMYDPLACAVTLYSEVGSYYTRCGFSIPFGYTVPQCILFPPLSSSEEYQQQQQQGRDEVVSLTEIKESDPDAEEKWEQVKAFNRVKLSGSLFLECPFSKVPVFWVANDSFPPACPLPKALGCTAIRKDPTTGQTVAEATLFWVPFKFDKVLDVALIAGTDPQCLTALIKEARRVAGVECQLALGVRLWLDPDCWLASSSSSKGKIEEAEWVIANNGIMSTRKEIPFISVIRGLKSPDSWRFIPRVIC